MGKIPHNLHKCINCALTECNGGGYKCDTCGHLESAKQLSGYANVKGVYTPQTTGAAQAAKASTIPQTSDDMPIIPIDRRYLHRRPAGPGCDRLFEEKAELRLF